MEKGQPRCPNTQRPPSEHVHAPPQASKKAPYQEQADQRTTEQKASATPAANGTQRAGLLRAELIWDGKYEADGKRVMPLRVGLPFQTVEAVNESAQDRERNLFQKAAQEQTWRNRLIWGDKKYVLPSLLSEFAGKVNLIYIDPPFDTGADFSFTAAIPRADGEEEASLGFTKLPSIIEQKAYRDTWGRGLDSYLQWFYETVVLLHELLSPEGGIFVHLDWHVGYYAKVILDEVFGSDNFRNEIILPGRAVKNLQQQFDSISRLQIRHDNLLWYSRSPGRRYRPFWVEKHEAGNPEGHWHHFWSTADRPTMRYSLFGITPGSGQWIWKEERALRAVSNYKRYLREASGRTLAQYWRDTGSVLEFIRPSPDDGKPQYWRAPAESRIGDTVWSGVPVYSSQHKYPTEKNEAFLSQILNLASNEGDLILDCFVGSGTTAAVAEKLNRRWIACDLGRFAIHTTRKRLLDIPGVRPFVVQNIGKYERQLWQTGQFGTGRAESPEQAARRQREYIDFILKLYHATPIQGRAWLHGVRAGRMVHVGAVDAPVSLGDVTQIAAEFKRALGTGKDAPTTNGVDVLGWDFAFELHEVSKQQAEAANIRLRFLRIPREVMDKRAVDEGGIQRLFQKG